MSIYIEGFDIPQDGIVRVIMIESDGSVRFYGGSSVIARAVEVPPADVRPVVYCRDCKHRPYSTEPGETSGFAVEAPDRECKCPCFNPDDGYYSWIPADDFFCADGERRSADMRPTPEPPKEATT